MKRLSKKEIRAGIEAMKTKNEESANLKPKDNEAKLSPKISSQRIRKQGTN